MMRAKPINILRILTLLMILAIIQSCQHLLAFSDDRSPDFDSLFEQHGAIMMMIEPESGKILYVNNAALDFYGYARSSFTTLGIDDINTLSTEEIAIEMRNAIDEKRNFFNFKHKLSDGTIKDVEVYSYPFIHDGKSVLFSIIHDVSERVALEKREQSTTAWIVILLFLISTILFAYQFMLRRKNRLLTASNHMLENFNALRTEFINADNRLIYLKDEQLKYVFVNTAMEKFYGLPANELIGRTDFAISPGTFAELKESHDHEVLIKNKEIEREVHWNNRIYKALKFPIKMLNGTTGVGAYIEDVTEQVKLQKEIGKHALRNSLLSDAFGMTFPSDEAFFKSMLDMLLKVGASDYGCLIVKRKGNLEFILEFGERSKESYCLDLNDSTVKQKLDSFKGQLVTHVETISGMSVVVALSTKGDGYEMSDLDHVRSLANSLLRLRFQ